jgi:hypothetical protein
LDFWGLGDLDFWDLEIWIFGNWGFGFAGWGFGCGDFEIWLYARSRATAACLQSGETDHSRAKHGQRKSL